MSVIPFRNEIEKNQLSKLNPEIRIIIALIFGISFVFMKFIFSYILVIIPLIILGIFFKVPFKSIAKRTLYILPIIIMLSVFIPFTSGNQVIFSFKLLLWNVNIYRDGIVTALNLATRMLMIFFVFMYFFSSLTFSEFTRIRIFPTIIRGSLIIMLNFLPIFMLQNKKLTESQQLRGKNFSNRKEKIKSVGNIIGTTLIKANDQSVRIYESMRLRGFGGDIKLNTSKIKIHDIFWLITVIAFIFMIIFTFEFIWRLDIWRMIGLSM